MARIYTAPVREQTFITKGLVWTRLRVPLAVLAVVLAILAQRRVIVAPNVAAPLYGLAVALFVAAVATVPVALIGTQKLLEHNPAERMGRLQWLLLGLALLCTIVSFILFSRAANLRGWQLHLVSVALFAITFVRFTGLRRQTMGQHWARISRKLLHLRIHPLVLILMLATFVRMWQLADYPFGVWYDEAFFGNAAVDLLDPQSNWPVWNEGDTLPAHGNYLFALAFKLFGVSTFSIRLVSVVFGVLTVLFAYLLFRRWFGLRIALIAALMFAVMRYSVNFSRVGANWVTPPAFEVAILYFLDRGLQHRRLQDFAWAGLLLGFGLSFYFPVRLIAAALVVWIAGLLLMLLLKSVRNPRAWPQLLRPWLAPMGVFAVGLFLAVAPVVEFALRRPDVYFARTTTVSIFQQKSKTDEPLWPALQTNIRKHLLMFNVVGDRNPRHNLPNEPLLDPFMGALFVLGLGYALWRWRDPANFLMLLLFVTTLMGGILTLDFEAPQSLRSIAIMPVLIYFATIPFAALAALGRTVAYPRIANVGYALAVSGLLFAISYANLDTFFRRRQADSAVWLEHSATETIVAKEMRRLAPTHQLVVTDLFAAQPTLQFLAPEVTNVQFWNGNEPIVMPQDGSRGVAMLLGAQQKARFDEARQAYPTGIFRTFSPPAGGDPVLYEVVLSPQTLRTAQGVIARFFETATPEGTPANEAALTRIGVAAADRQANAKPLSIELRSNLLVRQYGEYRFTVQGAPQASLLVDESAVSTAPIMLAKGQHTVRLLLPPGNEAVELLWQGPGNAQPQPIPQEVLFRPTPALTGLLGSYYRGPQRQGQPTFTQIDPQVSFYFHNTPLPRPYSVRWQGKVFASVDGTYEFATSSIDDSQLYINDQLLVDNRQLGQTVQASLTLTKGWHDLRLEFEDNTGRTQVYLYWTPPGGSREVIPTRYLAPPQGRYASAAEIAALPVPATYTRENWTTVGPVLVEIVQDQVAQATAERPAAGAASTPQTAPASIQGLPDKQQWPPLVATIGAGQLREPRAVAVDQQQNVYVVDSNPQVQQIKKFDASGALVKSWGGVGAQTDDGRFVAAWAVAINQAGEVLVLDQDTGWVHVFNADGVFQRKWGGPQATMYHPRAMTVGRDDKIYITDTGGSRVLIYNQDGTRQKVLAGQASGLPESERAAQPSGVVALQTGELFVVDTEQGAVRHYTSDGRQVAQWTLPATSDAAVGPRLALDPNNAIYATFPAQCAFVQFDATGTAKGGGGSCDEPQYLGTPSAIAIGSDGKVYVAVLDQATIHVYTP